MTKKARDFSYTEKDSLKLCIGANHVKENGKSSSEEKTLSTKTWGVGMNVLEHSHLGWGCAEIRVFFFVVVVIVAAAASIWLSYIFDLPWL